MTSPAQVVSASLAASCFVAVTQILTRTDPLPPALFNAVCIFALAIPPLAALSMITPVDPAKVQKTGNVYVTFLFISWLTAVVGFWFLFSYFSTLVAVLFGVSVF